MLIGSVISSGILQGCSTGTITPPAPRNAISVSSPAGQVYPPQSAKYSDAKKLLLSGHYNEYVQRLGQYGAEGDLQCQDELGKLYVTGRIVHQDYKKAFEIYRELTVRNYGPAICHLAYMYINGFACQKDYKKASALFNRATALGCDLGTAGTAYMYRDGLGCKTDYAKALSLYDELAAKNSPLGWSGKASLFWNGWGVKQDPNQSIILLQRAAEAGLLDAQSWLADQFCYSEKIPVNYKLSRYWAERGSEQGDGECQLRLSFLKMQGIGGEKDCAGGISLLKALADQSMPEAQNRLGHSYRDGECVKKNLAEAKIWLEKAAENGNVRAVNEIADMYFWGDGVPKSLEKWFELNKRGATQKDAPTEPRASCEYNVGLAYENGWGVKQDMNEARAWYEKGAAGGNPHACNNLSIIYRYGKCGAVNLKLAESLRQKGVENGCWMACISLGEDYAYGRNGMAKNIPEAVRLFKKSIELCSKNNQTANYELGRIYEEGLAGKVDTKLALQYYREAARYGSTKATARVNELGTVMEKK